MLIKNNIDEIQNYLLDASNYKGTADAVYFPINKAEIIEILADTNEKRIPVTISGNGTGLTGARVPEGGIVISTEKMNGIVEINKDFMYAVVEPGVILSDLLSKLKENGLLYPPDPTEKNCFVGGTVATNASGEKTFKYGPTRNYILELEIILSDGEILYLKRGELFAKDNNLELTTLSGKLIKLAIPDYKMPKVKNAAGYFIKPGMDAIDLFIGSEGTLGVITLIKLKLLPLPEKIISCVIFFDIEQNALSFIQKAREASYTSRAYNNIQSIDALSLEFFDHNALNFLRNDYPQIPSSAKAGVWFEQEVTRHNEDFFLDQWMELISEFCGDEESAWFAFSENDKVKIQEFRHAISSKVNEFISHNNLKKLGTDSAVPDDQFIVFYNFAIDEVKKANLKYVLYGHFGNSHIHLNMLPANDIEYSLGKEVYMSICKKAVELGGTISAEHGIGKLKKDYFKIMYDETALQSMIKMKKSLDPNMILGVGTIF